VVPNISSQSSRSLDQILDLPHYQIRYIQEFIAGKNILVNDNFVEKESGVFSNDSDLVLTEKSVSLLKDSGLNLVLESKKRSKSILYPEDLPAKELIYSADEERQISMIREMITEDKLAIVRKRLEAKNLPLGVAILLHGRPGTGKTETAFQLARHTGRQIMKVEISQTKSMWYGESEKIIKRIFTDYSKLTDNSATTPILLLNEADAIMGKRKESPRSSVEQTDNAIQNIFLEEMENFKGILIATTNHIRYYPDDKTYSLDDTDDDTLNRILRFLEVNAVVGIVNGDAISRFSFSTDGSYKGLAHIRALLNAIQTHNKINFSHRKFTDDMSRQVKNMCPVLLREYLGRWYVAGFFGHHENNLFTYGLDRISGIEVTPEVFEVSSDPAKAFESVIGISIVKPEVVELECTSHQANYLKTLPWHKSQEIIEESDEKTIFRFFISPNYELLQKILMMGPEVRVIKPDSLARQVLHSLKKSLDLYKKMV